MSEPSWKETCFWSAVVAVAVVSFIVWFSAGYRIGLKTPPNEPTTYRIEIIHHHEPIGTISVEVPEAQDKWYADMAVNELKTRGSLPFRPSWNGGRTQAILDGPPGLDAPWWRVK